MKKASATVIYDSKTNKIYNFTINYKGALIPLIRYKPKEQMHIYSYESFQRMYKSVINIAKVNGFYFGKYIEFGVEWYNIEWIDINNQYEINKHSYKGVN